MRLPVTILVVLLGVGITFAQSKELPLRSVTVANDELKGEQVKPTEARLVSARYIASMTDDGLAGTAEWNIVGDGELSLEPFQLAPRELRGAEKTQPPLFLPAVGRTGRTLRIQRSQGDLVHFRWSMLGSEEHANYRYSFVVPVAPVAWLELDLPQNLKPIQAEKLVLGPFPSPTSGERRLWKIGLGGLSRLDFSVVRSATANASYRADRAMKFFITPGERRLECDFEIVPLSGRAASHQLELSDNLRVTDVIGAAKWSFDSMTRKLTIPTGDTVDRVKIIAKQERSSPSANIESVVCPSIRLLGSVPGRDTITLELDPDLELRHLDPGNYRSTPAGGADKTGVRIVLAGSPAPEELRAERRLPVLQITMREVELEWEQKSVLHVVGDENHLETTFQIRVVRGPLAFLPLLPNSTVPDSVSVMEQDEAPYQPLPNVDSGYARFILARPLSTGRRITVKMVSTIPLLFQQIGGYGFVRPPVHSLATTATRITILASEYVVACSPSFRAIFATEPKNRRVTSDGWTIFTFDGQGVDVGLIQLQPAPSRIAAEAVARCELIREQDTDFLMFYATYSLHANVPGSSAELVIPSDPEVSWTIDESEESNFRLVDRTLGVMAIAGVPAHGTPVRSILFPDLPVVGATTVSLSGRRRLRSDAEEIRFRTPRIVGLDNFPLRLTVGELFAARFRHAVEESYLELRPRGSVLDDSRPERQKWTILDPAMRITVNADGQMETIFTGRIGQAGGKTLRLLTPVDSVVERVTLAGRRVDHAIDGHRVLLPVPVETRAEFEIHWSRRIPEIEPFSLRSVTADAPQLVVRQSDGATGAVELEPFPDITTTWELDPNLRAWPQLDRPRNRDQNSVPILHRATLTTLSLAGVILVIGMGLGTLARGVRRRALVGFGLWTLFLGIAVRLAPDGWSEATRHPFLAGMAMFTLFVARGVRRGLTEVRAEARAQEAVSGKLPSTASFRIGALLVPFFIMGSALAGENAESPAASDSEKNTRRPFAALPPVLFTSAEYQGSIGTDGLVRCTATFRGITTAKGEQRLLIPVTGVRLVDARLGDTPLSLEGAEEGYAARISGEGEWTLTLRFVVNSSESGTLRNARFGVPDVLDSRVILSGPSEQSQPEVVNRRGTQTVKRTIVEAELGGGKAIHLRWREGNLSEKNARLPPIARVKSVCIWDLHEGQTEGIAAFQYQMTRGETSTLRIELPPRVEPGEVILRPVLKPDTPRDSVPRLPGIRSVTPFVQTNGSRLLSIAFREPLQESVWVIFRLHPTFIASNEQTLVAPQPNKGIGDRGLTFENETLLVTRTRSGRFETIDEGAWKNSTAKTLAEAFKECMLPAELELDRKIPYELRQHEPSMGSAEIRVRAVITESESLVTDAKWTIDTFTGATMNASVKIRGKRLRDAELIFAEPITVASISGKELHSWSRHRDRIKLWFVKPSDENDESREIALQLSAVSPIPLNEHNGQKLACLIAAPRNSRGKSSGHVFVRQLDGGVFDSPKDPAQRLVTASDWAIDSDQGWSVNVYPPTQSMPAPIFETIKELRNNKLHYQVMTRIGLPRNQPVRLVLGINGVSEFTWNLLDTTHQRPVKHRVVPTKGELQEVLVEPTTGSLATLTIDAEIPLESQLPEPIVRIAGLSFPIRSRVLFLPDHVPIAPVVGGTLRGNSIEGTARRVYGSAPFGLKVENYRYCLQGFGSGGWAIRSTQEAKVESPVSPTPTDLTTVPVESESEIRNPTLYERIRAFRQGVGPFAPAAAWACGIPALIFLTLRHGKRYAPERLAACGAVGSLAAGVESAAGGAFALLIAAAAVWRIGLIVWGIVTHFFPATRGLAEGS